MTEAISVNNSFIAFPFQAEHQLGQKVKANSEVGYIIGIKLGRLGWDYLVLLGSPPSAESEEAWFHNQQLEPYNH